MANSGNSIAFAPVWMCSLALVLPVQAETAPPAARNPGLGIAILASDIGRDYAVSNLLEVAEAGGFSPVIVDWAWITFHWERTDFQALRQLVAGLRARKVEVAAMYRPRFLGTPTVPEQMSADGAPAANHGRYPCFSSPAARQWSAHWGEQILNRCPEFDEIVIYNPLDLCQCPACRHVRSNDPYAGIWTFLSEAKHAWQKNKPTVKLGVVFIADKDFWLRGKNIVDTARPFLVVRDDADMNANLAGILEVQRILDRRAAASLAKVTWGAEDTVSLKALAEFNRLASQRGMASFLWTFDTLFLSPKYDPPALAHALGLDYARLQPSLQRLRQAAEADHSIHPGAVSETK